MENVGLAIALAAWFAYTVWAYCALKDANSEIRKLNNKVDSEQRERVALSRENNQLHALAYPVKPPADLPRIFTADEFGKPHARRWHEQNKDVAKALKWDDAAKGEQ
jgi:hypothetical protein